MSVQAQLEARRAVFVESEKESKRRETELAEQLAVVQAQLSEVRAAAARTKEDQLNTVLAGSQSVSECSRWGWGSLAAVVLDGSVRRGQGMLSAVIAYVIIA